MVPADCPSDDVLGALVQQGLDAAETERVTAHIDGCPECQAVVIAAVRGIPRGVDEPAPSPLPATLAPGTRFGRYEVRELIGAGGMGHVYRAYDAELDRSIALKVLRPELGTRAALVERLLRESRIMAKVSHPSVITVHDVGREGDRVFIAMELVRGPTLAAYIAQHEPPWHEIVRLFQRAGEGLAAAHREGIVHRDFKPDNVLVDAERKRVIVTDFGIARSGIEADGPPARPSTRELALTATGAAIGTPAYMAPEQLDGEKVDVRADVFAFSVSLWEALCRERPFRGTTVAEIRAAMERPPTPTRALPWRLVRALERGLALDPDKRWRSMDPYLNALVGVRARRQRAWLGAAAVALVGLGIAGALVLARPAKVDPCAAAIAPVEATLSPARREAFAAAITDPQVRAKLLLAVGDRVSKWRTTQLATCHTDRDPVQAPTVAACLDARKRELVGYIDDVIADHGRYANTMSGLVGDPKLCATPAPGLITARVPDEPALRRQVTQLRYELFAAEEARDGADFAGARKIALGVLPRTQIWEPLHAEALYLLGTIEMEGGDHKVALARFREGAALAEKVHQDQTAVNCWVQLVSVTAFDEGDPKRAIEYVTYAEAASNRIGNPPDIATMVAYVKGTALVEADRKQEAEVALRRAVELAETGAPDYLPQAIQGLGYLYEDLGRYDDAVKAYRRALEKLPEHAPGSPTSRLVFRERLASNLSSLGRSEEAEKEARAAAELADRTLGAETTDRATAHSVLAEVLIDSGKAQEGLREATAVRAAFERINGPRSERFGETLELEAGALIALHRYADAEHLLARACEILAFTLGDDSSTLAECWVNDASALGQLHREAQGIALLDKALPLLVKAYGAEHVQVANARVMRGQLHSELHQDAAALADLEEALAQFTRQQVEIGRVASAKWALAHHLWTHDPARARRLLDEALDGFATASGTWKDAADEAREWKATDGHPKKK